MENLIELINKIPIKTPIYIVDVNIIKNNLAILNSVQQRTNCKILLALKGFSMFSLFPVIKQTLHGICASSPNEARPGREEFNREVHSFAAAYSDSDFSELLKFSDHIVFNSFIQAEHFIPIAEKSVYKNVQFGLRCNPEHSETEVKMYDPCAPNSRLGITVDKFHGRNLDNISGLHFHTLCEKNSDSLERTLEVFTHKFDEYIRKMDWINFGGGHHITRSDYDVDLLCRLINDFKNKYNKTIYLEPGEAIALNSGYLISTVLDIVHNGIDIAILDTSAACHMPDVLEMPYRPEVFGAGKPFTKKHTYRFAGKSCLAGDIISDYSFDDKLKIGDKVIFMDMAHYTMVKNTTFNGLDLPSIAIYNPDNNDIKIVKQFDYSDFKGRLS